ncbi:MAG: tetratricopeptide repeat protein [Candidatus Marinimicrobia bacterium]|nr:tetratricopeptide repeat protein [FCB group bacterium]MBL7024899.1 tetratricopeptide repeat protein [Candidatus Neomarinimicrobiota bacterium]
MSEQKNGPGGIIQELRNRRVFRAVAVYLGVGFALLEAADIVIPMLGLPAYVVKTVFWLLIAGFPAAIGLAWTFQLTPEGLRRSPKSGEKQTEAQKPFTGNSMIIVLLLVIVGLLAYPRMQSSPPPDVAVTYQQADSLDAKAVAVLPFTNFSASAEDAYFADGIHDDILTQLSKIRDLKVISRTTMVKYKNTEKSIKEIAQEIGVANLLEGSVRRAGNQVRIVAQLIKASTDEHLWAETYDRDYADIFSIQSDVAKKIAGALKSALSPEEKAELDEIPTRNMKAYDFFLKGNYYWHTKTTKEGNEKAVAMYEEAIKLDPSFGLAYARQSIAHSVLFQQPDWDPSPVRKAFAKKTLDQAIDLIPNHGETHFAHGIYYLWCLSDRDSAIKEFELAAEAQPKNGEVANHLGQLYAETGNWTKAGIYLENAFELDPDVVGHAAWLAGFYSITRKYEQAEKQFRIAIQSFPEFFLSYRFHARLRRYAYGDLVGARQILNDGILNVNSPEALAVERINLAMEAREFETALKLVREDYKGDYPSYHNSLILYGMGKMDEMNTEIQRSLSNHNSHLKVRPDDPYLHDRIGMLHALMGQHEKAILSAKRAIELEPVSKNALGGPDHLVDLAMTYSILGETDLALDIIDELLSYPGDFTIWMLKLRPAFDNLRESPRYQKLVGEIS